MSARRESERTGYIVFCGFAVLFSETEWGVSSDSAADVLFRAFDCSICHGQGAGVGDFVGFLPSVGAVFDVCQRVGRASARDTLFFCGFAVIFSKTGWGGGVSVLSAAALLVCMPAGHEGEHARPLVFAPLGIPIF